MVPAERIYDSVLTYDYEPRYDVVEQPDEELEISREIVVSADYPFKGKMRHRFDYKQENNDIRTATEDDQQQLRNLFIVIHLRSGGSISCLNTQHDTWTSN
ncbi:hypothetical protein F511_31054 [Dorcoceras hygrometricum]|uniref:Uncharacterized protein n=1 Tax=Dorcoceras hygrometricum TaxID=472368 RepID=A0A2Z7BH59_9LAMI|nr:hypothetical protein F511_31054 [Dorcoceras hygrometricum]